MKTYRISTSAELEGGSRDEVFDVEADEFQISSRGGVRVVRHAREAPAGRVARWLTIFRPHRENVAWVPHDSLISVRLLSEAPDPGEPVESHTDSSTVRLRPAGPDPASARRASRIAGP